ncbi:unnamed protein product, partial [Prorocentrum cordatum]
GIIIKPEQIVRESCYAKNALMTVGRTTPYKAVLGETPNLLQDFETPTTTQQEDQQHLHRARARELALSSMIEKTATERLIRSERSRTRPAGQKFQYKTGDLVDIFRTPPNKDLDGWRGPAKIVDATEETLNDGIVHVRWGGRVLICRLQDVRRHTSFWSSFFLQFPDEWAPLRAFVTELGRRMIVIGWVYAAQGWIIFQGARLHPGIFARGLMIAHMHMGLANCVGIRVGYGIHTIPEMHAVSFAPFAYWCTGQDGYSYLEWQGARRLDTTQVFGGRRLDTYWVQFLTVADADARTMQREGRDRALPDIDMDKAMGSFKDDSNEDVIPAGASSSSGPNALAPDARQVQVPDDDDQAELETIPYDEDGDRLDEVSMDDDGEVRDENLYVDAWWAAVSSHCSGQIIETKDFFNVNEALSGVPQPNATGGELPAIEFDDTLVHWMECGHFVTHMDDWREGRLVPRWDSSRRSWCFLIEREMHNLTKEEERIHHKDVLAAKLKELKSRAELEAFCPVPRGAGDNVMTGRWVLRWKIIDGAKTVKARLFIRGFMGQQQGGLDTASFTARSTSQRLVLGVGVQYCWAIFSWDIGNAFLRGLSFTEIKEQGAEVMREACLDPPADVFFILQEFKAFKGTSKLTHLLNLLKGAYGLKDAPRLWKLRLDQYLTTVGGQQSSLDGCIWVWFKDGNLHRLLSTHIDDLKGAGTPEWRARLFGQLKSKFGKIAVQEREFEHCGIQYKQLDDGSITITQDHYIKELKPIPLTAEQKSSPDDVAAPTIMDVINLNRVLKWVKRKPCVIRFEKLLPPLRVLVISDSAFKRENGESMARRGHILALAEKQGDNPGGRAHWLEAVSKRHRRVTRSTFAAEINGLADAIEPGKVIAMQCSEVINGTATARQMASDASQGSWPVRMEAVIDADSVFKSVTAEDVKLPLEESLISIVISVREQFSLCLLERLWWCSAVDMLAGAMTKGACAR